MSKVVTLNLLEEKDLKPVHCRISSGQVVLGLTFEKLRDPLPYIILCAERSESLNRFFLADGKKAYISSTGSVFTELGDLVATTPFVAEYTEGNTPHAVIYGGENMLLYSHETSSGKKCEKKYSCGVMHCGRLFGGDGENGYILRWSGPNGAGDDEEKLHGGGYVALDPEYGSIIGISRLGEKLVAVRERGLTVVKMFGKPENFSVEIKDTSTDGIIKNTAREVKGKLIFMTQSGLKSFDGSAVEKLTHRYAADIADPKSSAAFSGMYFLGCKSKLSGEDKVLCYDPSDGESYYLNSSADFLTSGSCVYAFGKEGIFYTAPASGYTLTFESDLGLSGEKTLRDIFIGGECEIEIGNGKISRSFKGGLIKPRMRGEVFTFKITGSTPLKFLKATAEVMNGI